MALPDTLRTPAPPANERNLAVNFFHAQLEKIKSGRIKRYDLITFTRDWDGNVHLYSLAQRIIGGEKIFSDSEIKAGVQSLLNELTGKDNGLEAVDLITSDKPADGTFLVSCSREIPTLVNQVRIGIKKEFDNYGERSRTYYLFHSRA